MRTKKIQNSCQNCFFFEALYHKDERLINSGHCSKLNIITFKFDDCSKFKSKGQIQALFTQQTKLL